MTNASVAERAPSAFSSVCCGSRTHGAVIPAAFIAVRKSSTESVGFCATRMKLTPFAR